MNSADPIVALRARVAALGPKEREALRLQLEARGIAWERVAPEEALLVAERPARLPLTPGQKHFWIQQSLYPESSAYHVAYRWHFEGVLDREALEKSLATIVSRHAPLRTGFPVEAGEPWQQVHPTFDFAMGFTDLETTGQDGEALALSVATEPFDLAEAPLIRAHLFRYSKTDHLLAITLHHIIADGWSRGVLMRELTTCYRAFHAGQTPALPQITRAFGDLALDQQAWLESPECRRAQDYWKQTLSGLKPLELPSDRSRSTSVDMTSATAAKIIPVSVSAKVAALASQLGTTPFVVMAAAFKLLLHRYSGERDLSICIPVAGRSDPDAASLIGLFTNTLVLRTTLDPRMTFAQWVAAVQERFSDALDHQAFPFPLISETLGMSRDQRQNPLSQVMFQLQSESYRSQNAEQIDFGIDGLSVRQQPARLTETKVDLSWYVMERESGYLLNIEYRTAIFDVWRIERMAAHFEVLLNSILQSPHAVLPTLAYLSEEERAAAIALGTPIARPVPDMTVHEAIAEMAMQQPDSVALESEGRRWTYGELQKDVDALAEALVGLAVQPGDRVAVSLPGRGQSVIAFLAILKAGAIYVPLDPDHPADRVAYVLEHSGVALVLTDRPNLYPAHRCIDPTLPLPVREGAVTLPPSDPSRIAYLLYTSGSTGRPNGVPIGHVSLLNHLRSMAASPGLAPGDRLLAITTPTFDISILEMLLPLSVGATTVLYGQDLLLAPQRLAEVLVEDRISHLQATPAYWRMLIDSGWEGLPHLVALCGGEALDAPLARKLIARTKALWNVYGPTEATIWATALKVTPDHAQSGKVPVGGLLDNTHIHVLDPYMEPLPRGIPGELYIGGPCLSPGYWNRPALAASRFVPNPFYDENSPALRLYRTGDAVVRQADGEIEFIGRTDFQVKLRGYRIEIGEIEDKLLQDSVVEQAIVTLDAENERLIAYVLARDLPALDHGETERRLRQQLSAQLPRYMVPTAFVLMEEFPLNPNGKVDRKQLPLPQISTIRAIPVEARNETEATLLALWKAVLRREDIGIEDNFFDLGGDSIIGVQIVAKAQAQGLKLEPTQIFELQTVAAQAAAAGVGEGMASRIEVSEDASRFEMTPMQAGMLFHSLMEPDSGTYFEQCWCVLEGPLDIPAFQSAWQRVIARYEVLRGACRWADLERPIMIIADEVVPEWKQADWSMQSEAEQDAAFAAWLDADRRRGFVLEAAPLMRFSLIRLGAHRHRFVWSFHHLLMDGWCGSLLVGEMLKAYAGDALPTAPPSYRHYIAWRETQHGDAAQSYWTQALADLPDSGVFAEATYADAVQHSIVEIRRSVDAGIALRLMTMARRERLTLATVLQGAWALLLSRYGTEDDVVFGTVLSGRPPDLPDADRMIGLFLNTVPLRVRTRPDAKLVDWLQSLQAEHRQREKHGHAALGDIQRWAGRSADQPLFDSLLIIENLPLSMQAAFTDGAKALTLSDPGSYERTHYPVSVRIFPGTETEIALAADPAQLSAAAAERLLTHYETLLAAMADNPHACLGMIEMLNPTERETLLHKGRGPEALPAPLVHEQIFAVAAAHPDKAAILHVGEGADSVTTYADLARETDALASQLGERGIGRGAVVAVYMRRGTALLPSLLAVMRAGAAYLPIDPDYPRDRIAYMLADSGAVALLTDLAESERAGVAKHVAVIDPRELSHGKPSFKPVAVQSDDLAYILYTSGSTGHPKGVAITHGALANFIASMAVKPGIGAQDRLLALTTIGFDIAGLELFAPLAKGGTVLLAESAVARDGRRLVALMERLRPTVMQATPAGWRMLIEAGWRGDKALRMLCGGEALDSRLAADLLERGGALWNLYGPTETTIWSAAFEVTQDHLHGTGVPVAGPIDRTVLYVLDRCGELVAPGIAGELHIGGAGLSPGYWAKPGLTAERFVPNPFRKGIGDSHHLYRTGDLVRWREDGALDFLGRIDNQIKLRGYRMELGEIEARLASHTAVAEAAVMVEDRGAGKQLIAYVRWAGQRLEASPADLAVHMAQALPAYMIPSVYIALEAFPLTPNGKLDRRALSAYRPKNTEPKMIVPVSGEPAATLAAIWRDALKVEHVASGDNFFELGGHSLLVVSLQGVISRQFGVSIDITAFFRFPTLETMATHIAALQRGQNADPSGMDRSVSRVAGRDRLAGRRGLRAERSAL